MHDADNFHWMSILLIVVGIQQRIGLFSDFCRVSLATVRCCAQAHEAHSGRIYGINSRIGRRGALFGVASTSSAFGNSGDPGDHSSTLSACSS